MRRVRRGEESVVEGRGEDMVGGGGVGALAG